tara:strand:+ start:613 stop:765 length:153 start_codon:yes stop_codon:yes gene_type:complete
MPQEIFRQSLIWALAIEDEQEKDRQYKKQQSKSKGNETVKLDYSFLDGDF